LDRASFLADLPASWPGHMARREVSGYAKVLLLRYSSVLGPIS